MPLTLLKISIGNRAGAFSISENIGCLDSRCRSSSSRDIGLAVEDLVFAAEDNKTFDWLLRF